MHVVQPGETLSRIAQSYGRTWQELARWNNLADPNRLSVGQSLRVTPPGTTTATTGASSTPSTSTAGTTSPEATPAPSAVGTPATTTAAGSSATGSVMPSASAIVSPSVGMAVDPADSLTDPQGLRWSWPAAGTVIVGYGDGGSKGVSIAGKPGDAVMAAADGRVVYAGSGLRGYGNLIIVKHSTSFLTAYAHNQALLVKEDQAVKRGQKIAEMGSIDADRVKLHFEVRKDGKPVDPVKYLPAR
jgi:lipoprotein NlpD